MGVICSTKLKKHITTLEKTLVMLEEMKIQLSFLNVPVYDLLCSISEREYLRELSYLKECCKNISMGADFPNEWKKAVEKTSHLYKTDERERLLQLGSNLGASCTENQICILNMQIAYFGEFLDNAKNKNRKYGNTFTVLGALLGCMVFLLVI